MKRIVLACILSMFFLAFGCSAPAPAIPPSDPFQPHFDGAVFYYNNQEYNLSEIYTSPIYVDSILNCTFVGPHILVEGHVSPHANLYLIFDPQSQTFLNHQIYGANLIWHSDDISTAIYSCFGEVKNINGKVLGYVEGPGEIAAYITQLAFTEDYSQVSVTAETREGQLIQAKFPIRT